MPALLNVVRKAKVELIKANEIVWSDFIRNTRLKEDPTECKNSLQIYEKGMMYVSMLDQLIPECNKATVKEEAIILQVIDTVDEYNILVNSAFGRACS